MGLLERRNDFGQHISAGRPSGDYRKHTRHRFAECGESLSCLPQERFGAQHMGCEKFAGWG